MALVFKALGHYFWRRLYITAVIRTIDINFVPFPIAISAENISARLKRAKNLRENFLNAENNCQNFLTPVDFFLLQEKK